MSLLEAILLGIVQGLTEFLPVSSSGHLEIGKVLLGVDVEESLSYTVAVHAATVLSTIVVFRNDILKLMQGLFRFQWNEETRYIAMIIVSMVPVGIVGVFFKSNVEALFDGNLLLVGSMLLITASLLFLSSTIKRRVRSSIGFLDAIVIGVAQAFAVLPGISRAGSTIATGLIIGKERAEVARFSFLMVLLPILGATFIDIMQGSYSSEHGVGVLAIAMGSVAAFVSGFLACTWMLSLVKKGKLIWFSLYCAIVGGLSILSTFVW